MKKLVFLIPVLLMACAEKKQLNSMADSTNQMRNNTEELLEVSKGIQSGTHQLQDTSNRIESNTEANARNSEEINGKLDAQLEKTDEAFKSSKEFYDESLRRTSLQLRREALKSLLVASSGDKKMSEADKYFMSFEYQLWTGYGQDEHKEKRQEFIKESVAEFFKDLKEFYIPNKEVTPTAKMEDGQLYSDDNKDACFNALAAALHRTHRKQQENLVGMSTEAYYSMYKVIEMALLAEKDINSGAVESKTVLPYIHEVLFNKTAAVKLLQARMNFITMIFLSEVAPLHQGIWAKFKARYLSWSWNVNQLNVSQVENFIRYINAIKQTQSLLKSLGIPPEYSSDVVGLLKNARLEYVKTSHSEAASYKEIRAQLVSLFTEIQKSFSK